MKTVHPELIFGKNVLLRIDMDVPIENGRILDDTRLQACLDTLEMCLSDAQCVTVMGHIGRPGGKEVPELSVKPVVEWFEEIYEDLDLPEGKFHVMENLRFEHGEDSADPKFTAELAQYGDFYINEAFAAHHPAASTTDLPKLLPHAAGLRFSLEVETLLGVRNHPKKPLVVIIAGAKIEDKLPMLNYFAKVADAVLVGGKLPAEIKGKNFNFPGNVLVGKMNEGGTDLAEETAESFAKVIQNSKQVIWAGPVGKYEEEASIAGTKALASAVIKSGADSIVGGGDTITALDKLGLLDKMGFVSVGGGAMLKLLATGTLPTIEALQ